MLSMLLPLCLSLCLTVVAAVDSLSVQGSTLLTLGDTLTVAVEREVGQESTSDWVGVTDTGDTISTFSPSLTWEWVVLDAANTGSVTLSTSSLTAGQVYDVYYLADSGYRLPNSDLFHTVYSTLSALHFKSI
jgi:hypothetical protein